MTRRSRNLLATLALAATAAAIAASPAAAAVPAPAFSVTTVVTPTHLPPAGQSVSTGSVLYEVVVRNVGALPTSGPITITDQLPAGITATSDFGYPFLSDDAARNNFDANPCQTGPPVTCTTFGTTGHFLDPALPPGGTMVVNIAVDIAPAAEGSLALNHVTVSGGGAPTVSDDVSNLYSATPAPFGLQDSSFSLTGVDGQPITQAGDHPLLFTTRFLLNSVSDPNGGATVPAEAPKDVTVTLPPGLVVNPQAAPTCTEAQFETLSLGVDDSCPAATAIGIAHTAIAPFGFLTLGSTSPLRNLVPPPGAPAELGLVVSVFGIGAPIHLGGGIDSADRFQLTADGADLTEYGAAAGAEVSLFGDPSASTWDPRRGGCAEKTYIQDGTTCPVAPSSTPLLTMPSACSGPLSALFSIDSWQNPGSFIDASAQTADGVDGCSALAFQPTLQARPTTNLADSPSGLSVDVGVPQASGQNSLATSTLKKAVVSLPPGLVVNPSGANGLDACSSAQVGLTTPVGQDSPIHFSADHPHCPDASKLGTVEVDTPLLPDPLPGAVYIAKPYDNPFDSLLAIYIVIDDPSTGVTIKLAGHVVADPQSGQLVTTVDQNPQLPFSDFKLNFFGGAEAALRTPPTCGAYSTTSQLSPWSGNPPAGPHDDYSISGGANGGSCHASQDDQPNSPSFDAGTVTPVAGAFSPFVLNLNRDDGTQQFSKVTVSPPAGLVAKLAGTPACTDAQIAQAQSRSNTGDGATEQSDPSCPAASQVGTVDVAAGAGPDPYNTTAKAYMAGPYKGEPLSLAIITPAVAGPFDLGVVVTRVAIHIDPNTAQITTTSDDLPTILDGIPLDIRSARVKLDKPNFTLNGTSCDESSVTGSLLSTLGQTASLSQRFQLAECSSLGFKPSLALRLQGGHLRNGHPALTSTLTYPSGDYANLRKAQVVLPPSMQLDQSHIQAPCTRPQFAAGQCPDASIIGSVTATSPLLDYALTGPVYLRTGNNPLPDVVLALHGPASQPIEIDQVGKIDTVNARLRTTFESVPDAPLSKAVISLVGGSKGLLVNNTNLCKKVNRATVLLDGQNSATADSTPKMAVKCPKAHKKKKHHKKHKRHLPHRRAVG